MGDRDSGIGGLILIAVIAGWFAWSTISDLEKERDDLRAQVENLQAKLSDVREKSTALETSSDELKSQMARFASEDWRDVVPDAEAASDQVSSDEDDLKESAGEE